MDLPTWAVWGLVILNIVWAVFVIVVMFKVLWLTNEAEPFFRRENERANMARYEEDRAKGIRSGSRY